MPRVSLRLGLVVAAVSLVSSCGLFGPEPARVVVDVSDGVAGAPTRFVVRNTDDHVVFLDRCGDHLRPMVDRWNEGTWEQSAGGFCQGNLAMDPVPLGPRQERLDSLTFGEPGYYRVRLSARPGAATSPQKTITSRRFQLRCNRCVMAQRASP